MGPKFSEHFTVAELACHDGNPVPGKLYGNAKAICERAEIIRAELAARGLDPRLEVRSGYRTLAYNTKLWEEAKARGDKSLPAIHSQHLTASALDLHSYALSAQKLAGLCEELIASGRLPQGGLGTYPREDNGWIHIDLRPEKHRWHG